MTMKIGYHVDRSRSLIEDMPIQLSKSGFENYYQESALLCKLFQDGMSKQGMHYMSNSTIFNGPEIQFRDISSSIIEQNVEFTRNILHPTIPSRFQCFFAFPTINDIFLWPMFCDQDYPVFEIQYDETCPVLDSYFLKGGIDYKGVYSPTMGLICAEQYLSGKMSDSPMLEVLIPLPVTIGKCIGSIRSLKK